MKILTFNTWQERGPWRLRWDMILEGLEEMQPDIVGFQEIFNPDWAQDVKRKADFPYLVFHPESSGLMLLSRHEVVRSACLTMKTKSPTEDYLRYALFAEIRIQKKRLAVFNTHLSWQLDEGPVREKQVEELLVFIRERAAGLETVVMGDFNSTPQSTEIAKMILGGGLTDSFGSLYPQDAGFTWDNENPYARNSGHPMPDRRIDYIFTRALEGPLKELGSVKIVLKRPGSTGIWPSDHFGLLASFED